VQGGADQGRPREGAESIDYLSIPGVTRARRAALSPQKYPRHRLLALLGDCRRIGEGEGMETAVRNAKAWVSAAIAAADRFSVGRGHGPIHHFHGFY
jgi:hydroxymethylpyrimidine/phosphomethylpyrimidine kinase